MATQTTDIQGDPKWQDAAWGESLTALARQIARLDEKRAGLALERDRLIRDALGAGVPPRTLKLWTGLALQRIHQIKNHTR
jgi:hypothetical protein